MGSPWSAMAISTPLLLLLPILAPTLLGDAPDQPEQGPLQWDQGKHGGLQGSETWFTPPGFNWPPHLQSKRYWPALVDNLFLNRFGKITKREQTLEKKDNLAAEKMTGGKNMKREEEEQRIDETIRILQGVLLRGRKYSRFA